MRSLAFPFLSVSLGGWAEGEMAVIDPSALTVVGRIRLEDWQALE